VLGEPFLHHGDLAFLGFDYLFGEFADWGPLPYCSATFAISVAPRPKRAGACM
jgi:hypothetical protein